MGIEIESLSDEELKATAKRMGVIFDWSAWLSPRYQLIQAIKAVISLQEAESELDRYAFDLKKVDG